MKSNGAKRSVADPGEKSTPVRRTPAAGFLAWLLDAAGLLIVAGVIVQVFVFTKPLMTPVDVGGTLLGGAIGVLVNTAGLTAATGGVLVVALLRLPGFRLAWIAAGGMPLVLGALALWSYPDDYGGNLIFSPQRSEIAFMMGLGGAFLVLGALLHRYVTMPRLSNRWLSMAFRLPVMAGMALLFIAFPTMLQIKRHQPPLPPCAHDSMGRQLTVCL